MEYDFSIYVRQDVDALEQKIQTTAAGIFCFFLLSQFFSY